MSGSDGAGELGAGRGAAEAVGGGRNGSGSGRHLRRDGAGPGRRGAHERAGGPRRRDREHSAARFEPGGQVGVAQVDGDPVVLLERELDPEVECDEGCDRKPRQEGDFVDRREVLRVAHGEGEVSAEPLERDDEEVRGELGRDEAEDVGADLGQVRGRAGGDSVLHGERPEEQVLADPAQLQEVRAEAPLLLHLLGEGAVPQLLGDGFTTHENVPDPAPHEENLAGTEAEAG